MDIKHQLRQKSSDFLIVLALTIFLIVINDTNMWDINFINVISWVILLSYFAFLTAFLLKMLFKKPSYYISDNYLVFDELFGSKQFNISELNISRKVKMGIWRHIKISDSKEKYYIYNSYYSSIDIENLENFLQMEILRK